MEIHDTPEYRKAQKQHVKAAKNRKLDFDPSLEWTPFRAAEKRFKARFPPPDLSDVLDFAHGDVNGVDVSLDTVRALAVQRIPGLVVLPDLLSPQKQKELIRWSLSKHARKPNETNLNTHYILPSEGLWNAYLSAQKDPQRDLLIQPRALSTNPPDFEPPTKGGLGPRQLIDNTPASTEAFQLLSKTPKPPADPSPTVPPLPVSSMIYKLRWANIGWYYHWGTKQYDFTKGKGEVDEVLREICKKAVGSVDWGKVFSEGWGEGEGEGEWEKWNETYEPDAGIVNFYQEKDTLMAHIDKSELCPTSPLVSLSLGCSAIFLIGGLTRQVDPIPILLRSGDALIMAGPKCRRAFHGVPRILEGSCPEYLGGGGGEWESYADFLKTTRINVNVRQVFPKGFDPTTASFPPSSVDPLSSSSSAPPS